MFSYDGNAGREFSTCDRQGIGILSLLTRI
jgi:hypothetical protein